MPHVAQMKGLKRLNLDNVGYPAEGVALTDEGSQHLGQLKNVTWIHLGKTQIGDSGLAELAKLSHLDDLIITYCENVTDEGVEKLQQALPNLKIDR